MLRLLVPFSILMVATLLIAGEDKGQMRPGLARALAEGEDIVIVERRQPPPRAEALIGALAEAPAKTTAAPPVKPPAVAVVTLASAEASVKPAVAPVADIGPQTARPPAPVFTLSALPTLGGDQARLEDAADAAGADMRFVKGSLVNVRLDPTTDSAVVGQLTMGEAVSVISTTDTGWVEIAIEGDGIHGFVASRLLTRVAP